MGTVPPKALRSSDELLSMRVETVRLWLGEVRVSARHPDPQGSPLVFPSPFSTSALPAVRVRFGMDAVFARLPSLSCEVHCLCASMEDADLCG